MRGRLTVKDAVLMLAGVAVMATSQVYLRPRKNDNGFSARMVKQQSDKANAFDRQGGVPL